MSYNIVDIRTSSKEDPAISVLIIYAGGTIGMVYDEDGSLIPFNFEKVLEMIPEMSRLELKVTVITGPNPIDSSNVNIEDWKELSSIIRDNYEKYDGFVVLHGTDTMAYSASALSFTLMGIQKPVIFTGAQIPIGNIRSDARENLLTALEIASAQGDDAPIVREVCIYFNHLLLRGNRSQKVRSSTFGAFESQNYPVLAESGISIEYNYSGLLETRIEFNKIESDFDENVAIFKLFPGINEQLVNVFFETPKMRGIVLESFGSGNTMNTDWFLKSLASAIDRGIIIYNVSQCSGGEVIQGRYETSKKLNEMGVISGGDITTESAITKLMFLLGTESKLDVVKEKLKIPLNGEMDI